MEAPTEELEVFSSILLQEYIRLMTAADYVKHENNLSGAKFAVSEDNYKKMMEEPLQTALISDIIHKDFYFVGEYCLIIETIKKSLKPVDYLILIAAIILFAGFDYDNLEITDKIYIVTFVIWFLLLSVRIYIIHQGGNQK